MSAGEENQPINRGDQTRRLSSKRSILDAPIVNKDISLEVSRPDKRIRPMDRPEIGSDCDTEVSSTVSSTVTARREWLKEFGKQHQNTFPRKTAIQSNTTISAFKPSAPMPAMRTPPPKGRRGTLLTSTESAASTLVNRMMMSEPPKRGFAPVPQKPKLSSDEVQATNDGYASVAKLSQWLANDPTSTKKKKHVRRGKNVINKSRNYEKDLENVIIIETNMPRGTVQDRKKLIQGALRDDGRRPNYGTPVRKNMVSRYAMSEAGAGTLASHISVSEKKDWLKKAFKAAIDEAPKVEDESRSEIVTNDAASSLSVSDKKDWLKNAFNKSSNTPGYKKAMTDVMHNRGGGDDDAAARAKRRFLERSRRTPTKSTPQPKPAVENSNMHSASKSQPKEELPVRDLTLEERTGPPDVGSVVEPTPTSEVSFQVEEDRTPVDFRAAREALIQRSKQNGQKMQVVNKVYLKKTKFEKIEKEHRRLSGPQGLLKPSWEEADSTTGRPSTAYDKKFVPDIAPKKSFEELP